MSMYRSIYQLGSMVFGDIRGKVVSYFVFFRGGMFDIGVSAEWVSCVCLKEGAYGKASVYLVRAVMIPLEIVVNRKTRRECTICLSKGLSFHV